ncbi:hypothetical protein HP397_03245 [Streptobacillus felis]|uniref:Uncharacterized protein n=1 Tax=Streptobacillus felis TaxID=1384509 RepID=A0A7Z0PF16_9FUSO|nr:hypothetical protein [Streptobacillus felis]NYV27839.1 hypothetical protein [Streptobacillus felis]
MAKNKVISGEYCGRVVSSSIGEPYIITGFFKTLNLSEIVESYEVLDEEKLKSASSAIIRGAIGATILGPVGLLAGLSAKNKISKIILLRLKDGKESIIEVDQKIYMSIIKTLNKY